MGKRIVIIGGVAAGPKAASRIKRVLPEADVTLIDQDNLISYGGCGIPYYVSGDVSDEQELRSTSFHMVRDAYFFTQAKGVSGLSHGELSRSVFDALSLKFEDYAADPDVRGPARIAAALAALVSAGKVKRVRFSGKTYYESR